MCKALNFPPFEIKVKEEQGRHLVFDRTRNKYVVLTPEEWVRQHLVEYLVRYKNYPAGRVVVEYAVKVNKTDKRADILIFDEQGKPFLVAECKAPKVAISQHVFDQIVRYNISLGVSVLVVSNGLDHYCCVFDEESRRYVYVPDIPEWEGGHE